MNAAVKAELEPVALRPRFRKGAKHPRSLGTAPLTIAERKEVAELEAELRAAGAYRPMPRTRAECPPPGTPCPHVRCRFHLALDVAASGAVKVAHADPVDVVNLAAMRETCALVVADRAAAQQAVTGLEKVGQLMGLSLEGVRQIEKAALAKLKRTIGNAAEYPPALRREIARLVAGMGAR